MGINYSPVVVRDGLVLHLDAGNPKSYPGSGTTWTDLSGNGNTGTLTNTPTYDSTNGGSIVFAGTARIAIVNTAGLNLTGSSPISIITWIKPTSGGGMVMSGGTAYGLFSEASIRYWYYDSNPNWKNFSSTTSPITNAVWNQIAVTHVPGSVSLPTFYYNGTALATSGAAPTPINTGTASSATIGEYNVYQPYSQFLGRIAISLMYNRVLTAAEVKQNFNAYRGRFGL
jgi:hypothetical protein